MRDGNWEQLYFVGEPCPLGGPPAGAEQYATEAAAKAAADRRKPKKDYNGLSPTTCMSVASGAECAGELARYLRGKCWVAHVRGGKRHEILTEFFDFRASYDRHDDPACYCNLQKVRAALDPEVVLRGLQGDQEFALLMGGEFEKDVVVRRLGEDLYIVYDSDTR